MTTDDFYEPYKYWDPFIEREEESKVESQESRDEDE